MNDTIRGLESQIEGLKKQLAEARSQASPEPVTNFEFESASGTAHLADFFGEKDDLLVIHNMGKSCNYCTLWADGFSGYQRHLTERASFVLVSPDDPETQAKLAGARNWTFNMAQDKSREFSSAMGVWSEKEGWWPGVSGFHRNEDGSIVRTGFAVFGPGDDFCLVWPMHELLPGGTHGWEPH